MKKIFLHIKYQPGSKNLYGIMAAIALVFTIASCSVPKTAYYFKNLPQDTSINTMGRGEDIKIQKNDILLINFSSLNPTEDAIYNAPSVVAGTGGIPGYRVDSNGNIQLHRLGVIKVEGLTRALLKDKLQQDISPYLKDPVVTVYFQNHKITVMGEVGSPKVINMPEEQLPILEALTMSGEVSDYARRDNILVIRDTETGKQFKRINLEDQSIFTSAWYWLKPGDVLYVQPNDNKEKEAKRARLQQNLALGVTALSIAVIVLDRIIK
ncbi:MAG: polysaccharide biosynthesis/export family protein [Chitinophagaceae bacterium]|nr:polysaccharide biosynthesis/export family protein [Chitinophagaceae bacterium]